MAQNGCQPNVWRFATFITTGRLEECAAAADGREMDGSSALAKLVGSQAQFLIHRTSVILGRATAEAPTVRPSSNVNAPWDALWAAALWWRSGGGSAR